jgi:hypothetical protein
MDVIERSIHRVTEVKKSPTASNASSKKDIKIKVLNYTVAGKAIGFALEQPLHVAALACSASGI